MNPTIIPLILALLAMPANADTIYLVDGGVFQATVTKSGEDAISIRIKKEDIDPEFDYAVTYDTVTSARSGILGLKDGPFLRGVLMATDTDTFTVSMMKDQISNIDYAVTKDTPTSLSQRTPAAVPDRQKERKRRRQCEDAIGAPVPAMLSYFERCASHLEKLVGHGEPIDPRQIVLVPRQYDAKGRPVVRNSIEQRLLHFGDVFSIVHLERGSPIVGFDVVVVAGNTAEFLPLDPIFDWTEKGFMYGASVSALLGQGAASAPGNVGLVVLLAPAAAGTAAGAAIGLVDGVVSSVEQFPKLFLGKLTRLISYTVYSYDADDRLVLMRQYSGDRGKESVRTEFQYFGTSKVPGRSRITNLQTGEVRLGP